MAQGLRQFVAFTLCVIPLFATSVASAENPAVNVQIFRPSPHQGDFVNVQGATLPDANVWTTSLVANYGKNSLVFIDTDSPTCAGNPDLASCRQEIVQDRMTLDIMGSYSILKWVDIGLAIPLHLVNSGEDNVLDGVEPLGGAALGDARLSPKVRLIHRGDDDQGFGLAVNALMVLPTATDANGYLSDGFSAQPNVIADFKVGGLHIATNLGMRFREEQTLPTTDKGLVSVGQEFSYGAGASYRIVGEENAGVTVRGVNFTMMGEIQGATGDFTGNTTHIEGLLAGRVEMPDIGLSTMLGGASGFAPGYGNTKYRLFVGVGFAMPHNRDYDEDGILDEDDQCQEQAEDFDNHEDKDGCPDPDNDGDKIEDAVDRCPNDAEDFDKFDDTDGCPDLDNDGDSVADNKDKCPNDPEDRDNHKDWDGCPDPDNDGDGMADIADQCPDKKESINGYQDDDGCPDESLAKVEAGRIVILDKVYFEEKEDELMPQSFPVLRAVAGILRVTPSIKKVRIEGHTDGKGSSRKNLKLSQSRADTVMAFLVQEGVSASRLDAVGFGEEKPAMEGKSAEAREANNRVEFVIASQ